MFVFNCHLSKGSVIASYQLVLRNANTLAELGQIMKNYLQVNNGKMGSFEVNAESIQFSGKLTFECTYRKRNYLSYLFPM